MGKFLDFLCDIFGIDYEDSESDNQTTDKKPKYKSKRIMSDCEKYFYDILTENFSKNYIILPQINLASIIDKEKDFNKQYQNELYRNIDFGLIEKDSQQVKLLIEINDKTHTMSDRIQRDKKVKQICEDAKINLITFYTKYDNKKDYVINRIKKELKK